MPHLIQSAPRPSKKLNTKTIRTTAALSPVKTLAEVLLLQGPDFPHAIKIPTVPIFSSPMKGEISKTRPGIMTQLRIHSSPQSSQDQIVPSCQSPGIFAGTGQTCFFSGCGAGAGFRTIFSTPMSQWYPGPRDLSLPTGLSVCKVGVPNGCPSGPRRPTCLWVILGSNQRPIPHQRSCQPTSQPSVASAGLINPVPQGYFPVTVGKNHTG